MLFECKRNALKIQTLRLSDKDLRREELENRHLPHADLAPRTPLSPGTQGPRRHCPAGMCWLIAWRTIQMMELLITGCMDYVLEYVSSSC